MWIITYINVKVSNLSAYLLKLLDLKNSKEDTNFNLCYLHFHYIN